MNQPWELIIGMEFGDHILNPDWQRIQSELLKMEEGKTDNVMLMSLLGKGGIGVAGGDAGRYLVMYLPPEEGPDTPSLTLADPSLAGPDVTLTVQTPAQFPARNAVRFPLVLQVVEHFFRTGELPKNVRWEMSNTGREATL